MDGALNCSRKTMATLPEVGAGLAGLVWSWRDGVQVVGGGVGRLVVVVT